MRASTAWLVCTIRTNRQSALPPTETSKRGRSTDPHVVISVAPSPTGKLFATGSGDLRARIWKYVLLFLCIPFTAQLHLCISSHAGDRHRAYRLVSSSAFSYFSTVRVVAPSPPPPLLGACCPSSALRLREAGGKFVHRFGLSLTVSPHHTIDSAYGTISATYGLSRYLWGSSSYISHSAVLPTFCSRKAPN